MVLLVCESVFVSRSIAAAVFIISAISLLVSLLQTRRNMQQLHDMVRASSSVTVLRDGAGEPPPLPLPPPSLTLCVCVLQRCVE